MDILIRFTAQLGKAALGSGRHVKERRQACRSWEVALALARAPGLGGSPGGGPGGGRSHPRWPHPSLAADCIPWQQHLVVELLTAQKAQMNKWTPPGIQILRKSSTRGRQPTVLWRLANSHPKRR